MYFPAKSKRYRDRHPERVKASRSKWLASGGRAWLRNYMRKRRATDPFYEIRNRLTSRLAKVLRGTAIKKAFKTEELIGCTVAQCQAWIESKFSKGMTWALFLKGEIHIDHIRPCATFDLSKPSQQKACFHFSNLQPLWKSHNLSKNDS